MLNLLYQYTIYHLFNFFQAFFDSFPFLCPLFFSLLFFCCIQLPPRLLFLLSSFRFCDWILFFFFLLADFQARRQVIRIYSYIHFKIYNLLHLSLIITLSYNRTTPRSYICIFAVFPNSRYASVYNV